MLADQKDAFGQVASVPTAYRTLEEIAGGGDRAARKLTAAVSAARLWVTNLPAATKGWRGTTAYIDAAHRVHARVEDCIRTGKHTGIGHFPSHDFTVNQAWLTAAMTAQILLAWLKLTALDGDLARAEPRTLRPVNRTSGVDCLVPETGGLRRL